MVSRDSNIAVTPAGDSSMNKPKAELPKEKAGTLIFGWDTDDKGYPRLYMLSNYSEGRLATGGIKEPVLAKGSVDPGESMDVAAVRETLEESGIDPDLLRRGGYSGVSVRRNADGSVVEHPPLISRYRSANDSLHPLKLQVIELEPGGIRKLVPHLKGYQPQDRADCAHVVTPVRELARARGLPELGSMIKGFYSGIVPCMPDMAGIMVPAAKVLEQPILPRLIETYYSPRKNQKLPQTPKEWMDFLGAVKKKDKASYKVFLAQCSEVKKYLQEKNIVSDTGIIKMDDKDCPGAFYQERGQITTVGEFFRQSAELGARKGRYGHAAWNTHATEKHYAREVMPHTIFAPVIGFFAGIAPMEIADSAIRVPQKMRALLDEGEATGREPRALQQMNDEKPPLNHLGKKALRFADQFKQGATSDEPWAMQIRESRSATTPPEDLAPAQTR